MWDLITWLPKQLWELIAGRRQLQLLVHKAGFMATGRACYFINLTNLSRDREVEVTHVWFDLEPPQHAIQPDRRLPKRLKPDETWETWIEADKLPQDLGERAFGLARARLSNGRVVKSRKNRSVPSTGIVPGGPIARPPA